MVVAGFLNEMEPSLLLEEMTRENEDLRMKLRGM
jgi:hypothetical protein